MLSRALTRIASKQVGRRYGRQFSNPSSLLLKKTAVPSSYLLSSFILDRYTQEWKDKNIVTKVQRRGFSSQGGGGGMGSPPWVNPDNQVPGEALSKYSVDLTQLAKDGKLDPVIGRHEEIRRTLQILARRTKNNPVLIGEPGKLWGG